MRYKEDWEQAQKRLEAFWEGEVMERCCIGVLAPRETPLPCHFEYCPPTTLEQQWFDIEYRYEQILREFAHTFYGGEAFPFTISNLGPGVLAACLGGDFTLGEETVWFDSHPIISDWEEEHEFRIDASSFMWKKLVEMTETFSSRAASDFIVGIPDLGGNLDLLAALRGTQNLLLDLFDHGDAVKTALNRIDSAWIESFDHLFAIINKYKQGCTTWMPLWSSQTWYPLQCDFSAMISPEMFAEFVVPALEKEAGSLNHAIYHLDGPEALPHLDMILEIPQIQGIQWTPGAKIGSNQDIFCKDIYDLANPKWISMYQKIQAKGKNLVLLGASPQDVTTLLENLSHKGLYIYAQCATEQDAKDLLRTVACF
jgi:hypothetical protein